jgi:hypothetical protein
MDVTINHSDLQALIRLAGLGVDAYQGTERCSDVDAERFEAIAVAHRIPDGLPPKAALRLANEADETSALKALADKERLEADRDRLIARLALHRDSVPVPPVPPIMMPLTGIEGAIKAAIDSHDRSAVTKLIKTFLKARTGRTWSVTGGTGTAYGWLHIKAPQARLDGYRASMDDKVMLALALGLEHPTEDFSVAASGGHWLAALQRAAGLEVTGSEAQYWD